MSTSDSAIVVTSVDFNIYIFTFTKCHTYNVAKGSFEQKEKSIGPNLFSKFFMFDVERRGKVMAVEKESDKQSLITVRVHIPLSRSLLHRRRSSIK